VAAPPPTFTVTVTANTSVPEGVVPEQPGNSGNPNQWFYYYTLNAPGSLADSLPVHICVAANNSSAGAWPINQALDLSFGPTGNGGNLSSGVTLPAIPPFTADGCQDVYILINVNGLTTGGYNKVVEVKADSSSPQNAQVNITGKGIHIHIDVVDAPAAIRCFVTDSDFNSLLDCAGNQITSGSDGRFVIITNNKKVEVATNPGQFYYNVLWTNTTGTGQAITVNFARTGVVPQGAQAIHAMVFPSLPAITEANFELVNDGVPSGADDQLDSMIVPAGYTLWVDYHLEWAGLGKLIPVSIGATCSTANQLIAVSATVSAGGEILGTCGAGALGYKK
jgi:hypothetical protein